MSSVSPIKVGLLGAGYILDSHAAALSAIPQVELHAVCDQAKERAESAAAKFGISRVITSTKEMAASECDSVHILLPPALHLEAAGEMVEAGKSVFLEKPMGLNSAACAALCVRAKEKGVAIGVNHNFLFSRAYESVRSRLKSGEWGRIDQLTVNWHFGLSLLQFGPFDSWMLAAPANLLFELGPHVAAFVVDLIGVPKIETAVVGNPIEVPGGQTVYRHWTAVGAAGPMTTVMSLSTVSGHADRMLRVRGRGGSVQLDFGRDIHWAEVAVTENPIFDAYRTAEAAGRSLVKQASHDRSRRLLAALSKRPDANPFEESVSRSIRTFYENGIDRVDPRHDGHFAVDVIRVCEDVVAAAGVGSPSVTGISVSVPKPSRKPTVLIVGGSGFIGRRLARKLVDRGHSLRILTRRPRAAAIEFGNLPVELVAGSHADRECAERALEGIQVVYHLAKCEGKRWQDYVRGDIHPTRILAEAAVAAGVSRFIYTGTIASYASDRERQVIDNRTPVDPAIQRRGHYARSKAACEALLLQLHRDRSLPLVIMRPGIVIGPGSLPWHPGVGRFSSETRVEFWGSGANALPLVLVDDVADALVRGVEVEGIEGQTLLLTSPPLITALEYVAELSRCIGAPIEVRQRPAWKNWLADVIKELAKNAVRHPNRRWPTLHDWRCQSHLSRYDGTMTEAVLDWHPVTDRMTMVSRGIIEAVAWYLR